MCAFAKAVETVKRWCTDKGSLDKGGLPQPAFLNFDAELLFPIAHTMQVRLRGWSQFSPLHRHGRLSGWSWWVCGVQS